MPRSFYLINWHKYQPRTDKELPWLKLWGSFFDKPWWQEMDDDLKVIPLIFLDVSRRFNGKMPTKTDYYLRNYNLKLSEKQFEICCKYLITNGFLSDSPSDLQDKIRVDKTREERDIVNNLLITKENNQPPQEFKDLVKTLSQKKAVK